MRLFIIIKYKKGKTSLVNCLRETLRDAVLRQFRVGRFPTDTVATDGVDIKEVHVIKNE
jgi:hypothetical protein